MPTFVDSRSGDATVKSVLRRLLKTVMEGTFLACQLLYSCWQVWLCKDQNISVKVVSLAYGK